ncbi:LuxR C-terminal-related transcriptional regulator [Paenibacillus sp. YPG26]|uniref:LuxR C-terminal-related transcriptional regulator n=1 Tax=Paenibacillus sp. YPG26 TaxID=2878915 RepID=UPI0020419CA6|nr:LuxR C-terminal-related transcriptional regulator [Paenibacillus sp. YPG26]USB31591.1 LuxR C-terminal-related transcriptional regulator [Paenibacillus sp. YPG26]
MMTRRQRLIVESLRRTQEEQSLMDELQRLILEKLSSTDGHASIHIIWDHEEQEEGQQVPFQAANGPNSQTTTVPLSMRQMEIARLVCSHYSVRRIAAALHISENTVKKHIQNIKKTLEINESGSDFVYELRNKLGSVLLLDN